MSIVSINQGSSIPKYKQVISSIEKAICDGTLTIGDKLPSINSIKNQHSLSRDTVLTALYELKTRGVVQSIVGKGYYITSEDIAIKQKVFLLFDELNSFKEDLYNAFLKHLGSHVQVDIFFHHFNREIFDKLISENVGSYGYYVVMPANLKEPEQVIQKLPKDKVYILDQTSQELAAYSSIYQNFEKDIYKGLEKGMSLIKNYEKLILMFSPTRQPQGILNGFKKLCNENDVDFEVLAQFQDWEPQKGEAYVLLDDRSLIVAVKKIKERNLKLAQDVGIISYNDTLLKEIVEGGITTISTDFNRMGKRLAQMILNKEQVREENPSSLIIRKSL